MRAARWIPALLVALLVAGFSWQNRGELATLHLLTTTLVQVPLVWIVLGAFLLGMLAMFLLGLRHDLRTRRELRQHPVTAAPLQSPPH